MMYNLTPAVKNLLIINVIVFIAQKFAPVGDFATCFPGFSHGLPKDMISGYLSLWHVKTLCFKPYQLFTYMFVHGDFSHLFFNTLGLVFFGPILEDFWGTKKFILFFMIVGLGAAVFNVLINLYFGVEAFSSMLGASGAVYGILTAFGIIFPNMELRLFFLPITYKAKYMVMVMGMIAIYSTFKSNPMDNTSHLAHLGGIVIAMILIQFWRIKKYGND